VRDLLNQIPTLEDKLSEMENLSSQFLPVSNITENIKKIKELIEQARDAANRVNELPKVFMESRVFPIPKGPFADCSSIDS
jgi:DNA repair exonuclease SbcCD ATPase subunit